jgi:DNA replication and repair protein RecF
VPVACVRVLGFRNLAAGEVALGEGATVLWGPNGSGKTNLLEALCVALRGASCRTRNHREVIAFDQPLARAEADVSDGAERRTFLCSLTRDGSRRHRVDGSPADLADPPPLEVFLPDHLALIKGPPGERRRHLDRLCAALWPARADLRSRYGRALAQRNALLGRIRAGAAGPSSLDAWDRELADVGVQLIAARAAAVERLAPWFTRVAGELGLPGEGEVAYRPRSEAASAEAFAAALTERRSSDLARGYTGHGPHLDELRLRLAGRELRRYGSQGEQRAALLALLFAEREALVESGRPAPLMLLDDVMSELDPDRRRLLCERLERGGGQSLITATEPGQLPAGFERREVGIREGRALATTPATAGAPAALRAA